MQENRPVDNDEIEIDLVELFGELKRNVKLIVGTTLAFIVAAAIYCFMIAKPVYEYTALISVPSNVGVLIRVPISVPSNTGDSQINGFMETIKDDIKPAAQLNDKNNKIVDAKVLKGAPIIKVTFEGESVEKVKQFGDAYMKKALERINRDLVDKEQQKYDKEVVELIKKDIDYIANRINESSFTANDADKKLEYLIKKIEEKEQNKLFLKAGLAKEGIAPEKPVRPKKAQNIAIAAVLGLFLSCGYVTARFLIKKQ